MNVIHNKANQKRIIIIVIAAVAVAVVVGIAVVAVVLIVVFFSLACRLSSANCWSD